MIRTFIAAEADLEALDGLKPDLVHLHSRHPRVKWVKPENIHLTLKFLGDVKEGDLDELFAALSEEVKGISPFAVEVRGVGVFPNWRHPRVVWAGCGEGAEDMEALAQVVEDACTDLGYDRESRPFRPHLTLGRVKLPGDADGLEDSAAPLADKPYGFLDIDAIVVFMSSLRRTGPVYSPMLHIPLRKA